MSKPVCRICGKDFFGAINEGGLRIPYCKDHWYGRNNQIQNRTKRWSMRRTGTGSVEFQTPIGPVIVHVLHSLALNTLYWGQLILREVL